MAVTIKQRIKLALKHSLCKIEFNVYIGSSVAVTQFNLQCFQYITTSFKQGVQGLQAFYFCVVTVTDEHNKRRLTRKRRGYIII